MLANKNIIPVSKYIGAMVLDVDLAKIDEKTFTVISDAFDRYNGLLFREQSLSPEQLVKFSRLFGDLDHAPQMENGQTAVAGIPEIYIVSNILNENKEPIGSLGAGEAVWHTDMSYLPNPPDISMLYALEIPPVGGDTSLCSMAAAFNTLPDKIKTKVAQLSIKHDGTYNSGGLLRKGLRADNDPMTCAGQPHPIVCAHPRTKQPVLYLGRRRNAYIVGLEREESEDLLDTLWDYATLPQNSYTHRWQVGDLLMWDNRATMHRRDPFDYSARRLMQRTQIKGKLAPSAFGA
ncbi:MAG: TauD/TfdA dioxygenase family protein [Thalassobaculaceae bacterium]